MSETRRGLIFGVSAYASWGLVPLYWPLLQGAGAVELLAHRIAWSLVVVAVLLRIRPRPGWWRALRSRTSSLGYLATAAVLVAINWGVFIWAVVNGHVVETALGYFINPLVSVLLGVFVFRERLTRTQWIAIGVASVAVVFLTVEYGRPPWVALTLAFSFGTYGLCKKKAAVGALEGMTVETAILAPLAIGYLLWLQFTGQAMFGHAGLANGLLFVGTGVVTAVPLLLFAGAANRVPLTVVGLLQYIAPSLSFLIGVFAFHEPMPPSRLAGFALVWAAIALFTWDGLSRLRRMRRRPAGDAERSPSPRRARP